MLIGLKNPMEYKSVEEYSFHLENSVIGCALLDKKAASHIAALDEDTFFHPINKEALTAIKSLEKEGKPVDLTTVTDLMPGDRKAKALHLIDCFDNCITTVNYKAYIEALKEQASLRGLANIARAVLLRVKKRDMKSQEIALAAIKAIEGAHEREELISQEEALAQLLESKRQDAKGGAGIYLGVDSFDRFTGGIRGGKLVIIGARPGVGKSALALNAALKTAQQGKGVLMVSLEMSPAELMGRMLLKKGKSLSLTTKGVLADEDKRALKGIRELAIHYSDRANTPEKLRSCAMDLRRKGELGLIVIDYIQLMTTSQKGANRAETVAAISRGLKLLAMDLQIPIIALSQLNRESQSQSNGRLGVRRPTLAQFRDSGSIEQDGDMAILLWQPGSKVGLNAIDGERYDLCKKAGGEYTTIMLMKNREGRQGEFATNFVGERMSFGPLPFKGTR